MDFSEESALQGCISMSNLPAWEQCTEEFNCLVRRTGYPEQNHSSDPLPTEKNEQIKHFDFLNHLSFSPISEANCKGKGDTKGRATNTCGVST